MKVERVNVAVVGGGQAGLALSHELTETGVDHVVIERGRVGQSWRTRWDSFCVVTPNWTIQLPGGEYAGDDPDGFMPRDNFVAHLVAYATSFGAPLREGVDVWSVEPGAGGRLLLRTSTGDMEADAVVLATGTYQEPHRPPGAETLPSSLHVIGSESYANPEALPPGKVVVVGSGQTGCQIAEELNESGREVLLACGRAPWGPRRIEGRDTVAWLAETPFLEQTVADLPSPRARFAANVQATGRGGGHDLHYRTLQAAGVKLCGHFLGVEDSSIAFAPDLADSVAFGDDRYRDIGKMIHASCVERGIRPPDLPSPEPFEAEGPDRVDLEGLGAVIFTAGYRPDYARFVHFPNAFDEMGFPIQDDGASSVVPGLYFLGTHFLRKRKSSLLIGVGEDARIVAEKLAARHAV